MLTYDVFSRVLTQLVFETLCVCLQVQASSCRLHDIFILA